MNYLSRNKEHYDAFVDMILRIADKVEPDLRLALISQAAWFAATNHPGRFADHRLENLALATGAELERPRAICSRLQPNRLAGRRCVLHVATEVAGIGGHTRTIKNWAELDESSSHTLVLTRQVNSAVPEWIRSAICRTGGQVIVLPPTAPPTTRALWLRELSQGADLVVLHHFSEDPVPTVALAVPGLPPTAVIDQSDHVFWLGNSVADTVISLRKVGRAVCEQRRSVRHSSLLPIPLNEPPAAGAATAARRQLGISPGNVILLTIGRPKKYIPTTTHNFFSTSDKVLRAHCAAHLYLVGVEGQQAQPHLHSDTASRFHCVGEVQAPDSYRSAADIYLEGFPFGSQTAMLEAGLAGLAPVPAFAPVCQLLVTHDESYDGFLRVSQTEDEYLQAIDDLIRSPNRRKELGAECARRVRACHTGAGWLRRLTEVYEVVDQLAHSPAPAAPAPEAETADDYGLSLFHAFHCEGGSLGGDLRYKLRRAAFVAAFEARQAGDYSGARTVLRLARRTWGDDGSLARARAKLTPHRLFRQFVRPRKRLAPDVMS